MGAIAAYRPTVRGKRRIGSCGAPAALESVRVAERVLAELEAAAES